MVSAGDRAGGPKGGDEFGSTRAEVGQSARLDPGSNQHVFVIVRAFNEGKVLRSSILELRRVFPNVVVVDDGSVDESTAEALAGGAVVIRHPINLGPGAALQTGLRFVVQRRSVTVATFDPDGQHQVADLIRLVEKLESGQLDFVIGSRFLGTTEGMPLHRRVVLWAARHFTTLTTGVDLSDPHNGLRAMTGEVAARLTLRQDRFAYASELIGQLRSLGIRYGEIPVTIKYSDYSLGKGQKTSNSIRILFDLFVGWLMR